MKGAGADSSLPRVLAEPVFLAQPVLLFFPSGVHWRHVASHVASCARVDSIQVVGAYLSSSVTCLRKFWRVGRSRYAVARGHGRRQP